MKYQRKTIDYYKMEILKDGKWETILNTTDVYEYRKLLNKLYLKPIKHRGKKYRIKRKGGF